MVNYSFGSNGIGKVDMSQDLEFIYAMEKQQLFIFNSNYYYFEWITPVRAMKPESINPSKQLIKFRVLEKNFKKGPSFKR